MKLNYIFTASLAPCACSWQASSYKEKYVTTHSNGKNLLTYRCTYVSQAMQSFEHALYCSPTSSTTQGHSSWAQSAPSSVRQSLSKLKGFPLRGLASRLMYFHSTLPSLSQQSNVLLSQHVQQSHSSKVSLPGQSPQSAEANEREPPLLNWSPSQRLFREPLSSGFPLRERKVKSDNWLKLSGIVPVRQCSASVRPASLVKFP